MIALLGAAFCWAWIGPAAKYALNAGITPLEIAFWRSLVAGILFAFWSCSKQKQQSYSQSLILLTIAFGALVVASLETSNQMAVHLGGSSFAAVMLYSAPFWVTLTAVGLKWEKLDLFKVLALICTTVGILGISFLSEHTEIVLSPRAIAWGLVSGITYGGFTIFGKLFFEKNSPAFLLSIAFTAAAVAIFPWVDFHHKNSSAWMGIIVVSVVSTFIAYQLYAIGLKKTSAIRASLVTTLEPVLATIFAWFLWDERITFLQILSGLFIIGGACLVAGSSQKIRQ